MGAVWVGLESSLPPNLPSPPVFSLTPSSGAQQTAQGETGGEESCGPRADPATDPQRGREGRGEEEARLGEIPLVHCPPAPLLRELGACCWEPQKKWLRIKRES